jgi:hypothetical protein
MTIVSCVSCFSGCATVLSDRKYPVTFDNTGGQTYFVVRDQQNQIVHQGITPQQVTLDAKKSPFQRANYDVTFAGTGPYSQHRELKAGFDPWVVGNVVLGGIPGALVDGFSGAMFKLPEQVTADVPSQYAVADPARGARIASLPAKSLHSSDPTQSGLQQVEYQTSGAANDPPN